jgi:hypothetical protein
MTSVHVIIDTADLQYKFDGILENAPLNDKKNLIITIKSKYNDEIVDHVYKDWSGSFDGTTLKISAKNGEKIGIFTIVDLLNPDTDRLIDMARKYDGLIMAHNNSPYLFYDRKKDTFNQINQAEIIFITSH